MKTRKFNLINLLMLFAFLFLMVVDAGLVLADKAVVVGGRPFYEIRDQDDMDNNSAYSLATQQSIKAYVDDSWTQWFQAFDVWVDNTSVITTSTTPKLYEDNEVPVILWSHNDSAKCQFTFSAPSFYPGGLRLGVWARAESTYAPATSQIQLDWDILVNEDATSIQQSTSVYAQDPVNITADAAGKNELLTFTPSTTALAAIGANDLITIRMFPGNIGAGSIYVPGVFAYTSN